MSANSHHPIPAAILDAAASWLARRDRGLSAAEQDDYMQWLQADPRHTEALAQHAAALERMMQLYEWTPAHDTEPNPDLFAPRRANGAEHGEDAPSRRRSWWRHAALGLAAAAAIAVAFFLWERPWSRPEDATLASAPKSYLRVNERMALPDGSRVELKDGTQLVVEYSDKERRVKLTGGEAHFSVWKDPQRPFVVDAAGVEVRAVGTAFNVRLEDTRVQVLVTEGRVAVAPSAEQGEMRQEQGAEPLEAGAPPSAVRAPLFIGVGQRAVVPRVAMTESNIPAVEPVTIEEIARELSWQAPRLQFDETPLADAIAEFNRLNRHQLELADASLGVLRIGGTFRPDNVEGFVRLLTEDPAIGVQAESAGANRTRLRAR